MQQFTRQAMEAPGNDLGEEIVMIEHDFGAEQPVEKANREEDIGGIAELNDVEAPGSPYAPRQPGDGDPRGGIFPDEACRAVISKAERETVHRHTFHILRFPESRRSLPLGFSLPCRADDDGLPAGIAECCRLIPHPDVLRYGRILHHNHSLSLLRHAPISSLPPNCPASRSNVFLQSHPSFLQQSLEFRKLLRPLIFQPDL